MIQPILARLRETGDLATAYEAMKKAAAILDQAPVDPDANLTVGKYLCLVKGDWDKGISYLALGNEEKLKALAAKELQGVPAAEGQVALGDGWWDLATASEGVAQKQLQGRAAYWYRKALPGLTGLVKDKVEKRLQRFPTLAMGSATRPTAVGPSQPIDLLLPRRPSDVPKDAISREGNWYWFPDVQTDFNAAMSMAQKLKGRLVVISSKAEAEFVRSHVRGRTWIGARRIGGKWVNSFGKPQQFFFGTDFDNVEREDWATISANGIVFDITIHKPGNHFFVCIEWGDE